jgi:hypothetical protein
MELEEFWTAKDGEQELWTEKNCCLSGGNSKSGITTTRCVSPQKNAIQIFFAGDSSVLHYLLLIQSSLFKCMQIKTLQVHRIFCCPYRALRLLWSRGSMLAFGTQVHGFKPGRSRRIFKGEKILNTLSFGEEVKPSVPCRTFAAC